LKQFNYNVKREPTAQLHSKMFKLMFVFFVQINYYYTTKKKIIFLM